MTKHPTVSVVIIFFNAARFIGEALESVAAQTFGDWELILVDDGSTDGGPDIARRFAQSTANPVRMLQHPGGVNRGMSASRNLGASHASGRYLAFLDADDVWFPTKLAEQVVALDGEPRADALYGRTIYWASWPGSGRDASQKNSLARSISST
jgi:glycosyltransferase involved in cell wall biosynthesis